MSEYESVQKSTLKLKGVSDSSMKKKKKKEKKAKKMLEQISSSDKSDETKKVVRDRRTPAEIAYQERMERRNAEQLLDKASKTHKERILEFNERLDSLSEHFDIPKVSWTK